MGIPEPRPDPPAVQPPAEGKGFDPDALTRCMPALRRYARALARDGSLADDLVQETLLKALSAQQQFTVGSNLEAWLVTILRNTYRSERRRLHQQARLEAAMTGDPPEPDLRLAFVDLARDFHLLSAEQRLALTLVAGLGYSYSEAAKLCRCPIGTIRSRIKRARDRLIASRTAAWQ